MGTGTGRKQRFPRGAVWVTAAVLSSLGIAWGAPVVPTSSGMQTLQQVYDYENSQLIKDYNQLFSTLKPSAQNQLSAQEIAWIQEKRAACGTVAKAQQSTQGLGCLIQHTDQRIVQIRQQEYGVGSSGSPASPTASATSPTVSTGAVILAGCPSPSAIDGQSIQAIKQYFKSHGSALPASPPAACPPNECCVKTSALPEQQATQTQCATAPTASATPCNLASAQAKNRVDYNFISAREGHLRTSGYVPVHSNGTIIGRSGVTIGIGVDLGQQTTTGLANEGVSPALIKTVKPYLRRKGQAALTYLNKHPLVLTVQQAQALTTAAQTHIIDTVANEYTANSSPPINFFQLPGGAQTAIADLAYQYGPYLSARTPIYWNQVTHGEWAAAVQNLNNFGDAYPTRRILEANLIQGDINSGKLPASEGSCK